jgi:gentisate 1,2-dioxygenase
MKDGFHSLSIVNLVRNAWTWRLFHAGQGYKDVDRHFIMSNNSMEGHIEQFPVGTYERAHRHGPAATIVLLNGTGYSLMWPNSLGTTPWKEGSGDKVQRVNWGPGTMVVPPINWFHQHFNSGDQPARFVKLGGTPGNELYPMTSQIIEDWREKTEIRYREEDLHVRNLFEKELAEHGAKIQMPSREELIELERKSGDGALIVP